MTKPGNGSVPQQVNMIGKGTVFEGTLRSDGDVSVSGQIIGKLHAEGRAVVTQEGIVEGEVTAAHADISGTLHGDLQVHERLVLRSTARVEGTVRTGRLIVEEGAIFNGECQMGQGGQLRAKTDGPREAALPGRSGGKSDTHAQPKAEGKSETRPQAKPDRPLSSSSDKTTAEA